MSVTKPMAYYTTATRTLSVKTQWEVSGASVTLVTERRKIMIRVLNAKVRQTLLIVSCPTVLIVKQLLNEYLQKDIFYSSIL